MRSTHIQSLWGDNLRPTFHLPNCMVGIVAPHVIWQFCQSVMEPVVFVRGVKLGGGKMNVWF